jgi:cytochrome c oxidase subunit 2
VIRTLLVPLIALLFAVAPLAAAEGSPAAAALAEADRLVSVYNPDLLARVPGEKKPLTPIENPFMGEPASDVAAKVRETTWLSSLVFLPFLVLPQVLLLYVIFKFRDRKDGRRPATFTGNHTLEIIWTAIPCVALLLVAVPVWKLAWWMELPPVERATDGMRVEVIGRQYMWDYKYLKLGGGDDREGEKPVEVISNSALVPAPLVLVKDRVVSLDITSTDVNHAWWIPAFGVKQDAMAGRHTYAWFKPTKTGFYKGQCAELCGEGHGIMLISAVVVEAEQFRREWLPLKRQESEVNGVISALRTAQPDAAAVTAAVKSFLAKGDTPERRTALHFWVANHFAVAGRNRSGMTRDQFASHASTWRGAVAAATL